MTRQVVFTVSHGEDAEILWYNVRAVQRHMPWACHVVVAQRDPARVSKALQGTPAQLLTVRPRENGYLQQQAIKLMWHRFVDAEAVFQIDSDMIVTADPKPYPLWTKVPLASVDDSTRQQWMTRWLPGTQALLPNMEPMRHIYMLHGCGWFVTRHLSVQVCDQLTLIRGCVLQNHDDVYDHIQHQQHFSEYQAMGAVIDEDTEILGYNFTEDPCWPEVWTTPARASWTKAMRLRLNAAIGRSDAGDVNLAAQAMR